MSRNVFLIQRIDENKFSPEEGFLQKGFYVIQKTVDKNGIPTGEDEKIVARFDTEMVAKERIAQLEHEEYGQENGNDASQ